MKTVDNQQFIRQQWRMWIETASAAQSLFCTAQFIRQQWRMWIETCDRFVNMYPYGQFIRQQWRMWIETIREVRSFSSADSIHSPAMANVD